MPRNWVKITVNGLKRMKIDENGWKLPNLFLKIPRIGWQMLKRAKHALKWPQTAEQVD